MHVQIVHDYLTQLGGAERVVATWSKAYPDAAITTSVCNRSLVSQAIDSKRVRDGWMRFLPGISRHFKKYFLLYPLSYPRLGACSQGAVLISSSGFGHHVACGDDLFSICYCHTPPRFLWGQNEYLVYEIPSRWARIALKPLLEILRWVDLQSAKKIGVYLANSSCVAERVQRYYGRKAYVVFPPVDVARFRVSSVSGDYYVILSRLVGYKKIDVVIEAFRKSGRNLRIIGGGPDERRLAKLAPANVSLLGRLPDEEVVRQLSGAKAVIFPGEEDFGIVPIEANACGKPVVAFRAGGALDTIAEGLNGVFFEFQTPDSIVDAVERCERTVWSPDAIRRHAERFSTEVHLEKIRRFVVAASSGAGGINIV